MKLAMFTEKSSYVNWLKNEIESIRKNGLKMAREMYEAALRGETKESWMSTNKTTDEKVWDSHLRWLREQVEYLEKKVRKYQREIAKNI